MVPRNGKFKCAFAGCSERRWSRRSTAALNARMRLALHYAASNRLQTRPRTSQIVRFSITMVPTGVLKILHNAFMNNALGAP